MPAFAAVLFDLDGLLIDTERVSRDAGIRALADLGHAADHALMERLVGLDRHAGQRVLVAHFGVEIDAAALDRAWRAHAQRHYAAHGIALRPGAADLLDALDGIGMRRAVVTSSFRAGAARKLALAGLAARVEAVVSFDDVTRPKPDPEPYLKGAAALQADPRRCLAFEDSDTGARAARAAGCTVVQVPDLGAPTGDHAHHLAADLIAGARAAGLIP